jgi:hypothetical protein
MPTIIAIRPIVRNGILALISRGKPAVFSPLPRTSHEIGDLTIIVTMCGAGLLASLLLATYGVDLSPGFF